MRFTTMRVGVSFAACLVVSGIATQVAPATASASAPTSSSCKVKWPSTSCKTKIVWANLNDHSLLYSMCAPYSHYADWQVKDANNGAIVAQGRAQPATCNTGRIYGLHAAYWGWVFNTRDTATAFIANDR
jgi:hypothetical protein